MPASRLQRIEHVAETPPLDCAAPQRDGEQRAARHALDILHVTERAGRPGEGEQFRKCCLIDARFGEAVERPHLARNADRLPALREIERLDPEGIACSDGNAAHAVDQYKRVHALETVEHAVTPLQVALQDDFGVAARAEFRAARFELAAQLAEIIDLAVEDDGAAAGLVGHRLIGAVTGIHDRETAEYQRPARLGRAATGIRPAMEQVAVGAGEQILAKAPARLKEGGKAAHQAVPASK